MNRRCDNIHDSLLQSERAYADNLPPSVSYEQDPDTFSIVSSSEEPMREPVNNMRFPELIDPTSPKMKEQLTKIFEGPLLDAFLQDFGEDAFQVLGDLAGQDRLRKLSKLNDEEIERLCGSFGDAIGEKILSQATKDKLESGSNSRKHPIQYFLMSVCAAGISIISVVMTLFGGIMFVVASMAVLSFFLIDSVHFVVVKDIVNIIRQSLWLLTMTPILVVVLSMNYYLYQTLKSLLSAASFKGIRNTMWNFFKCRFLQVEWRGARHVIVNGVLLIIMILLSGGVGLLWGISIFRRITKGTTNVGIGVALTGGVYLAVYVLFLCAYLPLRAWFVFWCRNGTLPIVFTVMDQLFLLADKDDAEIWMGMIRWLPNGYTAWRSFLHPMDQDVKAWRKSPCQFCVSCIFAVLIVIKVIIDLICGFIDAANVKELGNSPWWTYLITLARFFIYLFLIPFLALYNPVQMWRRVASGEDTEYYDRTDLIVDEYENVHDVFENIIWTIDQTFGSSKSNYEAVDSKREPFTFTKIAFALTIVSIIVIPVTAMIISWTGTPVVIDEKMYSFDLNFDVFWKTSRSGICSTKIADWSVLELSALNALTRVVRDVAPHNEILLENITKDMFPSSFAQLQISTIEEGLTVGYIVEMEGRDALILDEAWEGAHLGSLWENIVMYYVQYAASLVLPGVSTLCKIVGSYLSIVAVWVYAICFGPRLISNNVADDITRIVNVYTANGTAPSIVIGHMNGGISAKYLSMTYGWTSAAFESPQFGGSTMNVILGNVEVQDQIYNLSIFSDNLESRLSAGYSSIYNYYSESSLFSFPERNAAINEMLPATQTWNNPSDVYDTFCLLSSRCSRVYQHRRFCFNIIGEEKYRQYNESWSREIEIVIQ